ncbi:IclR family transcriptional regulator [Pseudorhodoferax soli]|uniref:IclR family transcriptional regulator n=1 Tax=Pseudorhodoferax soli TaxID=545864 RepID=UPI00319DCB5B
MHAAADPRYASSLAHGLALLDAFADAPAGLSNKQLAERTGLSKASISRLSTQLLARGLLLFDAGTRRYRLGSSALTLGYPLLASLGVRRLARLPMSQLAEELGGAVSLAMRNHRHMVYVETCRWHQPSAFKPDVGAALPLLASAVGRAWLASAAPTERAQALAALRAHEPAQLAAWAPALAQARRDFAQRGLCFSPGHFQSEVHAVAVPLDVRLGGERLVLNCGLPARRLAPGELAGRVAPRLLALARRIEQEWRAESAGTAPPAAAWPPQPAPAPPARRRAGDDPATAAAQTLARGLDLLACFQPGDEVLGNAQLARRLGLSPQTVVRLTHTLVQLGLLRRNPLGSGYRLGAATVAIAYPMLAGLRLRALARPGMLALSQRIGGAVSLGLRHQAGMVYVQTAWRTDNRLLPPDTGAVMPMLSTAMGRAWLCGARPAERRAVLNEIAVRDPAAAHRHAGVVERAMAQFARHGHCSSRDFRPEIEAVAVPFAQPVDAIRFVLNCGVLAPQPLPARQVLALGSALTELVQELEAALAP